MPCDTRLAPRQTLAERQAEVSKALKELEQRLLAGLAAVVIGPQGAVAFTGWQGRSGLSDACAYRTLAVQGSWALRQAEAKAVAMSGRKVNTQAIAAGIHSHDDGKHWSKD